MDVPYLDRMKTHFKSHGKTKEYQCHTHKVHTVAWNCDGSRLASGSYDKNITLFSWEKDRLVKDHTIHGHRDSVDQLCWSPINKGQLATASQDKTVKMWDAPQRKCIATINTKGENINMAWSPKGDTIAVANKEDLVTFIDVKTHKVSVLEQFKFEVNEMSWNTTGDLFFLTTGQGTVLLLSFPDLKPVHTLSAHPANCVCLKFDPLGNYFAVGAADALVSVWDLANLVCVRTISRLDWPVRGISFSHDGKMLASASEDLFIDIAEVETGERVLEVPCEAPTFAVAWHPRLPVLAFACDDKERGSDRDAGTVKLFGLPSDS